MLPFFATTVTLVGTNNISSQRLDNWISNKHSVSFVLACSGFPSLSPFSRDTFLSCFVFCLIPVLLLPERNAKLPQIDGTLLLPGCCFCIWLRKAARFVQIFRHILQMRTLLLLWRAVLACSLCSSSPLNSAPQVATPHLHTFSSLSFVCPNTPCRSFSWRDALCFDWNFSPQTLHENRSPVCVRWCCWNPTWERNCLLQTYVCFCKDMQSSMKILIYVRPDRCNDIQAHELSCAPPGCCWFWIS